MYFVVQLIQRDQHPCHDLIYAREILALNSVVSSRKTNFLTVIPGMHGIILAQNGVAGSRKISVCDCSTRYA